MRAEKSAREKAIVRMGGCLYPSLFLFCATAAADTIHLKDGKEVKGLVVEQHADRLIMSTEKGEVPVMISTIREVEYDDPAQSFFQLGKAREVDNKLGEALAYYEKAVEANPDFEEAKKAALGVRNRFWAVSTQGPTGEVEKQQAIEDARHTRSPEAAGARVQNLRQTLKDNVGLSLEKKGDWTRVTFVDAKKDAGLVGMRKGDRLVSIDGESLRYLSLDVVVRAMTEPRFSNFTLEYDRDCFVERGAAKDVKGLGVKVKLEYQGVVVESVKKDGAADAVGVREKDLLTHIDGKPTRYMPLKKANELVRHSEKQKIALTVRRPALLTRK